MAAFAALVALLAGCGVDSFSFSTPPATPPSSTTSTSATPDLTGVAVNKVAGRTTTTQPAIGPGAATVSGTVLGPQGPVAGATVKADRFVGSATASKQVVTAADGSWSMPGILGGRYRVRAWQSPSLAMTSPQIFFLGGSQTMSVDLQVQAFTGQSVSSAANPSSTLVGDNIAVVVAVSNQSVGPDGVVNYQRAAGVQVSLSGGTNVSVSLNPAVTDGNGNATFALTCVSPGSSTVTATTASGATTTVPNLSCDVAFIAPPITTPPPSSTTTSSTTLPGPTTSTTTTRRGP